MENFSRYQARCIIEKTGLKIDVFSEFKLFRACAIALQKAAVILRASAETGEPIDFDLSPQSSEKPNEVDINKNPRPNKNLIHHNDRVLLRKQNETTALTDLLASWWAEAQKAGLKISTFESYRHSINLFVDFIGHNDALLIIPSDIVRFKDFRLSTASRKNGRVPSAKTVKDSDLAGLKTIFSWAVSNKKMKTNPAQGITIKLVKPVRLRSRGFSDEEAVAILNAALHLRQGREANKTWAAKRWVPWLCAFTGARVGELAQLRKSDIISQGDFWFIRITPDAGPIKTNESRNVVVHQQLIDLGFIEFVELSLSGYLFLEPRSDGDILKPLQTIKNRLAEFGRQITADKGVAPNHGWRHRFKTVGIESGIEARILDAIQGHAPRNVSETYGEITLKAIRAAIEKLPYFEMEQLR